MASTPQTKFTVVLPTQDSATPPNALVVGELTQVDVEVTPAGGAKSVFTFPLDPATALGASVDIPFDRLTPPFVAVAGTQYTADAFAIDPAGNGLLSTSITWTQIAAAAPPAAPTGFSVA